MVNLLITSNLILFIKDLSFLCKVKTKVAIPILNHSTSCLVMLGPKLKPLSRKINKIPHNSSSISTGSTLIEMTSIMALVPCLEPLLETLSALILSSKQKSPKNMQMKVPYWPIQSDGDAWWRQSFSLLVTWTIHWRFWTCITLAQRFARLWDFKNIERAIKENTVVNRQSIQQMAEFFSFWHRSYNKIRFAKD